VQEAGSISKVSPAEPNKHSKSHVDAPNGGRKSMIYLKPKHYYAILHLSEPKMWDATIEAYVPFQLSEAEFTYVVEEEIGEANWNEALEEAYNYLKQEHPTEKIYHKRSRTSEKGKLYVMNLSNELGQVSCHFSRIRDKREQMLEERKRLFAI
jgi:hypothetical protein